MTTPTDPKTREAHERWLLDITSLPTAAGREHRVIRWIESWVRERTDLVLRRDPAGNLVIERTDAPAAADTPPLFITAHLDHPAFVIESIIIDPRTLTLGFRGGVLNPYFTNAPITLFAESRNDTPVHARVTSTKAQEPYRHCTVELEAGHTSESTGLTVGDIGRWSLPPAHIENGILHTHACDDLAALAAALAAFDQLRTNPGAAHVRLLFTRAEEIGFVGAIAACKHRTMPLNARVLALENSRSFPHDSPIGAGPIVRVGDRISTFSPTLTADVAKCAESLAKSREATPDKFRWQRKLMPGGACEASAYQAYAYDATCICLPLGNYHNMADLERVQAGDADAVASARAGHEFISVADFHALVDLLIACATGLTDAEPLTTMMERLYAERAFVLG
jgi:putative aminopeptidase FrvX